MTTTIGHVFINGCIASIFVMALSLWFSLSLAKRFRPGVKRIKMSVGKEKWNEWKETGAPLVAGAFKGWPFLRVSAWRFLKYFKIGSFLCHRSDNSSLPTTTPKSFNRVKIRKLKKIVFYHTITIPISWISITKTSLPQRLWVVFNLCSIPRTLRWSYLPFKTVTPHFLSIMSLCPDKFQKEYFSSCF